MHCRCIKSTCCRGSQAVLQAALAVQFAVITALGREGAALMVVLKFSVWVGCSCGWSRFFLQWFCLFQLGKIIWLSPGSHTAPNMHWLTIVHMDLTLVCPSPTSVWGPAGELLAHPEYSSPLGIAGWGWEGSTCNSFVALETWEKSVLFYEGSKFNTLSVFFFYKPCGRCWRHCCRRWNTLRNPDWSFFPDSWSLREIPASLPCQ